MGKEIHGKNYKLYINGLKGFACLMVMVGHYMGLYKYSEEFPFSNVITEIYDKFLNSKISFVIDESFWVILFFTVSGYLVSMSRIDSIKSFALKTVQRFLRLGIPVLFAYLIILVISKTAGFYTAETVDIFTNSYIQGNYTNEYSIWTVLKAPFDVLFLGATALNDPYWVLREMFLSSVIIYFLTFIKERFANKNIYIIISFIALFAGMVFSKVVFACLFGMLVYAFEKDSDLMLKNKWFAFFAAVFTASLYFIPRSRISCIFFAVLILFIPKMPVINRILTSKLAEFIGRISFGIYSFHWPVLCSFGLLTLIKLSEKTDLLTACIISAAVSVAITLVISVAYYHIFEKNIYKLLKKIKL